MTAKKRALITGITGQDGSYLAELLLDKGYEVFGMVRRASTENFDRIAHLTDRVTLLQADLLDPSSLLEALEDARPAEVYNLGAQSFVPTSWRQPVLTAEFTGRRRDAHARGDPPGRPRHPLLPGLVVGDVRQGARDAADRADAVLSRARPTAWPRRTATSSRSTTASPTASLPSPESSSTTRAPARARVRDPQDQRRGCAHQARAGRGLDAREPGRRTRLGLCR